MTIIGSFLFSYIKSEFKNLKYEQLSPSPNYGTTGRCNPSVPQPVSDEVPGNSARRDAYHTQKKMQNSATENREKRQ
jgi:hypothetical protein